jgi:hypothetical protein
MKNRVSITVTPQQEQEILTDIAALRAKISGIFTTALTADERENLFRLSDKRLAFDQKADAHLHQHPELRPPALDLAEYDKDGALLATSDRILAAITALAQPIENSRAAVGNDRMDADLEFYHYLKFISRTGTPGAQEVHDDLAISYPAGRRAGGGANPPA